MKHKILSQFYCFVFVLVLAFGLIILLSEYLTHLESNSYESSTTPTMDPLTTIVNLEMKILA